MAAKIDNMIEGDMDEILTCGICAERIKEPYTLKKCFHSFCKTCLDGLERKTSEEETELECPLCGTLTEESSVKKSIFIEKLLKIHSKSSGDDQKTCSCAAKSEIAWRCYDCKMQLCNNCKECHSIFPLMKNHKVAPIGSNTAEESVIDEVVLCNTHPNELIQFNCSDCEHLLCNKCKIYDHEAHDTETVEAALARLLPVIKKNKEKLDVNLECLSEQITKVDDEVKRANKSCEQHLKDVQRDADEKVEAIRKNELKLVRQIQMIEIQEQGRLVNVKAGLNRKMKSVKNLRSLVSVQVNNAKHTSLLQEIQGELFEMVQKFSEPMKQDAMVSINYPAYNAKEYNQNKIENVLKFAWNDNTRENFRSFPTNVGIDQLNAWAQSGCIELPNECDNHRMAIINGKLWFPGNKTGKIYVYNKELSRSKGRICNCGAPKSAFPRQNGHVILACEDTGLHEILETGRVIRFISKGNFCDVTGNRTHIFALNHVLKRVHAFNDEQNGELKLEFTMDVPKMCDSPHNSMVCKQNLLFVCSFTDKKVFCIEIAQRKILATSQWHSASPYLVGFDRDGHVLMSCVNYPNLYTWSGNLKMKAVPLNVNVADVTDAVMDKDNNLWVMSMQSQKIIRLAKK